LPFGDAIANLHRAFPVSVEDITVLKKIGLAIALFAITGVASASADSRGSDCLLHIGDLELFCKPVQQPGPVSAPEIDPASAMAGLTMLAGGLAVLRGRRKKISNE
jgi:hypothetical protein